VLDGDPALPPTIFSAHVYWDQTAGRIKIVLGTDYGGRPRSAQATVLDGDPARPLNFRPMFIIVIVTSLEHCTIAIGLFEFKFKF